MSQSTDVISGYVKVLPSSRNDSSDSEDDDDDDDAWLDFAEMSAMASGAQFIHCSKPKQQTVMLSTVDHTRQYLFVGRLILFDPWWLVTSAYVRKKETFYGRGFPTYELRTDPIVNRHRLVQQFLTSCTRKGENNDPIVEDLLNFIKETGDDNYLTFDMLEDKITEFSQGDEEKLKYVNTLVWNSEKGKMVMFALKFPKLLKMACRLLPYYLQKLMCSDCNETKSSQLDKTASDSPWVFGFKQILSRQYDLTGMEANISMFETSGVISEVRPIQRDALYVYNALKLDAGQKGHTYIPLRTLKCSERYFKTHVVRDWRKALEFLVDNKVIYTEPDGKRQNVFLYSNWKAERDVANGLECLLQRGTEHPPNWTVDFSSTDFEEIRMDKDQWLAAHLICNSPVTVLSGKGGCGKTTVVTKTLEHICKLSNIVNSSELIDTDDTPDNHLDQTEHDTDITPDNHLDQTDHDTDDTPDNHLDQTDHDTDVTPDNHPTCHDVAIQTEVDEHNETRSLSDTIFGSEILLSAPTGKAASLLGHKASLKSCTLHSIIMSYKMYCIERQRRLNKGLDPPVWTHSNKQVLVVDECSLVSVGTFATVLNILLSKCELSKLVLLGDVQQLPSIEPGNLLMDIFHLFQCVGFGVELRTNHRAESQLIVDNAVRIASQLNPVFDSSSKFHLLIPEVEDDYNRDIVVQKLLTESDAVQDQVTSQFVSFRRRDCEAINEICCKHYNRHTLRTHNNKLDFRVGDKVCMTKNGSIVNQLSRLPKTVNEKKQESAPSRTMSTPAKSVSDSSSSNSVRRLLDLRSCNDLATRESEGGDRESVPSRTVSTPAKSVSDGSSSNSVRRLLDLRSCNDLVTRESEVGDRESVPSTNKAVPRRGCVFGEALETAAVETKDRACQTAGVGQSDVKLTNGEVFFITEDVTEEIQGKRHRFITLSDKDKDQEKVVCAMFHDLRKECKMKHAWARTIHTYQGSESNTVVYVVGNCGFQTWQHVYTAVTRGRRAVYVVATPSRLDTVVRHHDDKRRTSLQEKLQKSLANQEQSIKLCQGRIRTSLNSYSNESVPNSESSKDNPLDSLPLFDSDDSWVTDIDTSTYGLELNDYEALFPSQTVGCDDTSLDNNTMNSHQMTSYDSSYRTHYPHSVETSFISRDSSVHLEANVSDSKVVDQIRLPESHSGTGDGVGGSEIRTAKRQAQERDISDEHVSPKKVTTTPTAATPMRNKFRQLSMEFVPSEDN